MLFTGFIEWKAGDFKGKECFKYAAKLNTDLFSRHKYLSVFDAQLTTY